MISFIDLIRNPVIQSAKLRKTAQNPHFSIYFKFPPLYNQATCALVRFNCITPYLPSENRQHLEIPEDTATRNNPLHKLSHSGVPIDAHWTLQTLVRNYKFNSTLAIFFWVFFCTLAMVT